MIITYQYVRQEPQYKHMHDHCRMRRAYWASFSASHSLLMSMIAICGERHIFISPRPQRGARVYVNYITLFWCLRRIKYKCIQSIHKRVACMSGYHPQMDRFSLMFVQSLTALSECIGGCCASCTSLNIINAGKVDWNGIYLTYKWKGPTIAMS